MDFERIDEYKAMAQRYEIELRFGEEYLMDKQATEALNHMQFLESVHAFATYNLLIQKNALKPVIIGAFRRCFRRSIIPL